MGLFEGSRRYWLIVAVVVLIVLATLPVYGGGGYTMILVTDILMYIILTVSWVMFSSPTKYLSLATAAFLGVGIYTAATLGMHWPLPFVILAGGLLSFVLAIVTGAITLRLRGIYFAIFTFGLGELIKYLLLWYEIEFTGTRGRFVIVVDNEIIYYYMLGIFVVLFVVTYLIRRSKYGLALQSIGENEDAAAHTGINTVLLKVMTFGISAFFMGAAGATIATRWTYVDPYIAFNYVNSFMPVLMAIFGGMGHLVGPVLGAAIFAYLQELLTTKLPYLYMLIFGLVLVIAILYLPSGLVGIVQKLRQRMKKEQHADS
jgi:branched-chain amino acid transport system permease protein